MPTTNQLEIDVGNKMFNNTEVSKSNPCDGNDVTL